LNEEIQQLDERGMVGTFGFEGNPNDRVHTSKTGFVNDFQNISHVARLAAEFAEADAIDESTQEENTRLRAKLDELQAQLDESNKAVKAEKARKKLSNQSR